MYRVLTVIENRMMLREVVNTLTQLPECQLKIALYSSQAFHHFVAENPNIVIIDAQIMLYYKTILEQFSYVGRDYHVVLIADGSLPLISDPRVLQLDRKDLSPESLLGLISVALSGKKDTVMQQPVFVKKWDGSFSFVSYPDVYSVLFAIGTAPDGKPMPQRDILSLRHLLESHGSCEMQVDARGNLLCLMRKSTMQSGFQLKQAGKFLFSQAGAHFAVIIAENVPWTELESACQRLTDCTSLGYFLQGEIVETSDGALAAKELSLQEVETLWQEILAACFENNSERLRKSIRAAFLQRLKVSRDWEAVGYMRCLLDIFWVVFCRVEQQNHVCSAAAFTTAEEESMHTEQRLLDAQTTIVNVGLPTVLRDVLCYIIAHFHEELSLAQAAEHLYMNKNYLNKLLGQYLGMSFLELLQTLRLGVANYLLRSTTWKIARIAQWVGYRDAHYFSRWHKKHTGITPEDVRKSRE